MEYSHASEILTLVLNTTSQDRSMVSVSLDGRLLLLFDLLLFDGRLLLLFDGALSVFITFSKT